MRRRVALVSTGGTIEKTYDEFSGALANRPGSPSAEHRGWAPVSVLDVMLASLQLHGVDIERIALMNKDSLEMSDADHDLIAATVEKLARDHDGVVIVHGTDRLAHTGHRIVERLGSPLPPREEPGVRARAAPRVPIILTGAMRPYVMRTTDALQNLTEALLAVQLMPPGVYVAMHNQVLQFPGVEKDSERGTFVKRR